jgi:hypothetical protein
MAIFYGIVRLNIFLGIAIGAVGALISWKENTVPHLVSLFPNVLTALVLWGLIFLALCFYLRPLQDKNFLSIVIIGGTISIAAGVVFGAGIVAQGLWRFGHPSFIGLSIAFLAALASAFIIGALASWGAFACLSIPVMLRGGTKKSA